MKTRSYSQKALVSACGFPVGRRSHRGVTLLELIAASLIISILLIAAYNLLQSSWNSYDNLVWQSKVNMEARQALDDICDYVRGSGNNLDMINPSQLTDPQVGLGSTPIRTVFRPIGGSWLVYQTQKQKSTGVWYLIRGSGRRMTSVAQMLTTVQFEYECRLPATSSDGAQPWRFVRVSQPTNDQFYLINVVYVTVTAQVSPYGAGGPTYSRQLTSAVHLRAPYNNLVPPARNGFPGAGS